jgi:hypothetical protein
VYDNVVGACWWSLPWYNGPIDVGFPFPYNQTRWSKLLNHHVFITSSYLYSGNEQYPRRCSTTWAYLVFIFVFCIHFTLQQLSQRKRKLRRCDFVFRWLQNGKVRGLNSSSRRNMGSILQFLCGSRDSVITKQTRGGRSRIFLFRSVYPPPHFNNLNLECTIWLLLPFPFGTLSKDKEREQPTTFSFSYCARI